VNILDLLGIDPEDFIWQDLSLCQNIDNPEDFFGEYEAEEETAKQVDQMCLHCPVLKECALAAQKNKYFGVWGGIYWDGTGKPDENKNSHKTTVVWDEIKTRIAE